MQRASRRQGTLG
jgi:hypothetical protein